MAKGTSNAETRQNALAFAYKVLTDKRNLSRYSDMGVLDLNTGEHFGYSDMLNVLEEMHKEAVEAQKEAERE